MDQVNSINWNMIISWIIIASGTIGISGLLIFFLRKEDHKSMRTTIEQMNANKPLQDMMETALTGVVSVKVLTDMQQAYMAISNQLMGLVATQQELAKAIMESQKFVTAITDGQPNVVPVEASASLAYVNTPDIVRQTDIEPGAVG